MTDPTVAQNVYQEPAVLAKISDQEILIGDTLDYNSEYLQLAIVSLNDKLCICDMTYHVITITYVRLSSYHRSTFSWSKYFHCYLI